MRFMYIRLHEPVQLDSAFTVIITSEQENIVPYVVCRPDFVLIGSHHLIVIIFND